MNKIIKTIPNILLIIIIIILSIYLLLKYTNNIGIYKVMTGSMEPNIHVGDYLLVKKSNEYKEGDEFSLLVYAVQTTDEKLEFL